MKLALVLLGWTIFTGGVSAEVRMKGYAFGDYYYNASGPDREQNGFQIRRIYLTFDNKWNDRFSGRVRLEANDAGFGSGGKMTAAIKDAWLRYRKDGRTLIAGLSPSPTWSFTESVWGYRSIEKTIMDLNKVGSSRDLGISFTTPLDANGKVKATAMVGNGNSNKSETDNHKKAYLRLDLAPSSNWGVNLYGDFETRPADRDRTTLSALAYGRSGSRAFGVEAVWQRRKGGTAGADVDVRGLSVFGRSKTNDGFGFFARADYFDPNDAAGDDAVTRLFAGVDITPAEKIHVMPNVVVEYFQDGAIETAVIPRVTVFFLF